MFLAQLSQSNNPRSDSVVSLTLLIKHLFDVLGTAEPKQHSEVKFCDVHSTADSRKLPHPGRQLCSVLDTCSVWTALRKKTLWCPWHCWVKTTPWSQTIRYRGRGSKKLRVYTQLSAVFNNYGSKREFKKKFFFSFSFKWKTRLSPTMRTIAQKAKVV
jgi:hypothetical protein